MANHASRWSNGPGRMILKVAAVVAAVSLMGACTASLRDVPLSGPRTQRVSAGFRTGVFDRYYNLHVPREYTYGKPMPLVVVIHGAFDTADGMARFTRFSELADREGFIVLYPEGIGLFGYLQHWNAGHCCGKAAAEGIDDVGFVAHAISAVEDRFAVNRVFMLGFSNGGMFVHRFAAERGTMLNGAAALAGSIGSRVGEEPASWLMPPPVAPVAMMNVHGTSDTDVPYGGGADSRGGTPRVYMSVDDSAAYWRSANGCSENGATAFLNRGAVEETRWEDCRSGKPVVLVTLHGWGHIWPGPYFTADLAEDHPLKDYDAAAVVWSFFSSLP